ncbi:MAG: hypothetical protein AB7O96_19795 [Pseudobdellovibrionaceae bacterium]
MSPSLLADQGTRIDLKSFKIFAPPEVTRTYTYKNGIYKGTTITRTPWAYYHNTDKAEEAGYSDHFAIYVDLNL